MSYETKKEKYERELLEACDKHWITLERALDKCSRNTESFCYADFNKGDVSLPCADEQT